MSRAKWIFTEPRLAEKLKPYWLMLLDLKLPPDPHELEHEDNVSAFFSGEVLRRARLGLGEQQQPEKVLEHVTEAARLVLFTEPGSEQERQAHMNLAHVLCVHVDHGVDLNKLKASVVAYEAPALVWWRRWLGALEFALTGAMRFPLERKAYLEDF